MRPGKWHSGSRRMGRSGDGKRRRRVVRALAVLLALWVPLMALPPTAEAGR